jgi:hypothetical protein
MTQVHPTQVQAFGVFSPLMLSDQLIALAQAADVAGYTGTAEQLVTLAFSVLDVQPEAKDRASTSSY